jgi:hypothetical protein
MTSIYDSPMALAAVTIALLAIAIAAGALLQARRAPGPGRLRETLWTAAGVLLLCGLAVAAVKAGLAR